MLKVKGSMVYWFLDDLCFVLVRRVRLKKYEKSSGRAQFVTDHSVAGPHQPEPASLVRLGMRTSKDLPAATGVFVR